MKKQCLLVGLEARRETGTWLDFAKSCGYLKEEDYLRLSEKYREVGKMLGGMLKDPSSFILKS
jgi:four helix bundle protein